jgi:hypothetical protein
MRVEEYFLALYANFLDIYLSSRVKFIADAIELLKEGWSVAKRTR